MKKPPRKATVHEKQVGRNRIQVILFKDRAAKWCSSHRWFIILMIIACSALFRVVYFIQLNSTDLINNHLWQEGDMSFTDQWARHISKGGLLSDTVMHPLHLWTKEVAAHYFSDHPGEFLRYKKEAGADSLTTGPAKLLWDKWYGGKQFHQEPLYAYFIAAIYKIFGFDVRWIFFWQMIAGIITNVIVYLLARRYFGDLVAVIASFIVVFCGPLMAYDLVLLRTSFTTLAAILIPYLLGIAEKRKKAGWWLLTGAVCGAGIALNSYFASFLILGLLILLYRFRKNLPGFAVAASGLIIGSILVFSPVIIRNVKVGAPLLSTSSNGAISFINDNNDTFLSFVGWKTNKQYSSNIMSASDASLLKSIVPTLSTHKSIGSWLKQLTGKLHALVSWYEIQNNANFYFYRTCAPVLYLLFISFLIISPLAITGLVLSIIKKSDAWPLYLGVIVILIPLLAFMVLSRYRISLLPLLAPFAALTVAEFLGPWKWKKNLLIIAGLIPLFLVAGSPRNDTTRKLWNSDFSIIYRVHYLESMEQAAKAGKLDLAISKITDFIDRYEPIAVRKHSQGYRCLYPEESDLFLYFADIHQVRARIYMAAGNEPAASADNDKARLLTNAGSPQ